MNVAYSPLLAGGYTPDKPPGEEYATAGNAARLNALAAVARETGATRNLGYDGHIAFAIVTHDTGGPDGGPVDGPLIANFLGALRSTG